jgi:phosphatidate cytidylyltransferase
MAFQNLQKRLVSALIVIPLGWVAVNAGFSVLPMWLTSHFPGSPRVLIYPGQVVSAILVLMGCAEYLRMLSIRFPRNGFWLVYLWLIFQFLSFFFPSISLSFRYDIYGLLLVVAAEAIVWGRARGRWMRASLLFSGTVFLSTAAFSLMHFYQVPFQKVFEPRFGIPMVSQMGLVTVFLAVFLCDSAAYFVGSWIGKHHFSSISPRKTIEGSVGGLCAAIIISTVGWYLFADPLYPRSLGIVMGVLIGVFAQAGDLLVSLMKRYFKVKDASDIIPGHGGILDRFDSVFFTAPILSVFFALVERVWG